MLEEFVDKKSLAEETLLRRAISGIRISGSPDAGLAGADVAEYIGHDGK